MRSTNLWCQRENAVPQPLSNWIQLNNGRSRFCFVDIGRQRKNQYSVVGRDVNGATQPKYPPAIIMTAIPNRTELLITVFLLRLVLNRLENINRANDMRRFVNPSSFLVRSLKAVRWDFQVKNWLGSGAIPLWSCWTFHPFHITRCIVNSESKISFNLLKLAISSQTNDTAQKVGKLTFI